MSKVIVHKKIQCPSYCGITLDYDSQERTSSSGREPAFIQTCCKKMKE